MKRDNSHTVLAFALMLLFGATGAVAGASSMAIRLVFVAFAATAAIVGLALLVQGRHAAAQ